MWSDQVDEILGGDQAVVLAYATPADGVVCAPVTNFGVRDQDCASVTVNSSIGMPRKLDRIGRNPRVALPFHTRRHGDSNRPEYVLVQGTAALSEPIANYPDALGDAWDRCDGPRPRSRLWKWWLTIYYTRVEIRIDVERVTVWPDLRCRGYPAVHGGHLPDESPAPHEPPQRGIGARIDHVGAARRASRLPDLLLGWIDADRRPMVAPVEVSGTDDTGIVLASPPGIVPPGGRRAGLTAHSFTRHVLGQHQRVHTGWLDGESDRVHYAPHTATGHRLPPVPSLYRLAVGYAARRGARTQRANRS